MSDAGYGLGAGTGRITPRQRVAALGCCVMGVVVLLPLEDREPA